MPIEDEAFVVASGPDGDATALVWGGGVRRNWDRTEGAAIRFEPADREYGLMSAFVQDEIALVPGRLFATIGAKYEHNSFSGGELKPNVRARIQLSPRQMAWGAVARAVRPIIGVELSGAHDAEGRVIAPDLPGHGDSDPMPDVTFRAIGEALTGTSYFCLPSGTYHSSR